VRVPGIVPPELFQQGEAFHARVRQGFLDEAARQPDRVVAISADRPIDDVQAAIRAIAVRWLESGKKAAQSR
jgi:thymidylate kinase